MLLSFRNQKKPTSDTDNKCLSKIQERIEKLESCIKLAHELTFTDAENDELAQLHCDRQVHGLQTRLNAYRLIILTKHASLSAEVENLIESYEALIDKMYCSKENCGHYLLIELQHELTMEQDAKKRHRIGIAIHICETKILLMGIKAKLLQIKLTQLLEIDWLEPRVEWELESVQNKYTDYENIDLYYSDGDFVVKFAIQYTKDNISDKKRYLPEEKFLEDLIMLHGTYDETATDMYKLLLDMLAIVIVRNADKKVLQQVEKSKALQELRLML